MIHAAITAVAGYLPEKRLTNWDLEKMVDTTDEWIKERTGIEERRILVGEDLGVSELAIPAVQELCKKANIEPSEIDLLIFATVTPDMVFPATANIVCDKIGARRAWGFDLSAACSGFIYALTVGAQFVQTGAYKKVVVVGADKMSSIIDYTDRNTCIIFGDGAGAVLLEPTTEDLGVMDFIHYSDGSGAQYLHMKAGGSKRPANFKTVENREHFVYQEGKNVFKYAVVKMAEVSLELMNKHQLKPEHIDWLVPHQANKRIIDSTVQRTGINPEKVMVNIHQYGNTTAATIPLCLRDYENQLKKGDNLILTSFGGGFTWGAIWVKWAYDGK
ncbi:MAG: 3-oxoacyl-[acyl-carrier-protein] synthase 3 [Bacteroidia bacterium]|nr:MAG: 3-oxoacyl-[acyl-carrier-protein] synthase 3 [Bacteroidia bacterium]